MSSASNPSLFYFFFETLCIFFFKNNDCYCRNNNIVSIIGLNFGAFAQKNNAEHFEHNLAKPTGRTMITILELPFNSTARMLLVD